MNTILNRIAKDGADKLALRFPSGALKGAGSAFAAAMNEEGRLVSGGGPSVPWRFESIEGEGDEAFIVGADPGLGRACASLDDIEGLQAGMNALLALARALVSLAAEGKLPRGFVSSGILLSEAKAGAEAGAVLFMPSSAVAKALSARGPEARAAALARLASPRSKDPESAASFFLAQVAYRYATGMPAFEREAAERGDLAGIRRYSTPAALAAPRLDPALAELIEKALDDPNRVGLGAWMETLEAAARAGWERKLSAEAEAELARRRASVEAETAKRLRRASFFRRRGSLLIGVGAAILIIAFVAGDMIQAQRSKPNFSALPPLELARRYYAAIDSIDLDSLEACGTVDALKADRNYLTNLVVITKTRMAYEGKNPILRAVDWIASGKPALAPTDLLYGIPVMDIAEEPEREVDGADARRFRATYSLWYMERIDDPSGDPSKVRSGPKEEKRVDELVLKRGKKGWQIVGLKRNVAP
jgi:hypothetical protein